MSKQGHSNFKLLSLALTWSIVACGGDERRPGSSGNGEGLAPGETHCLGAVCGAGQYCEGGAVCIPGCTSDANCLEGVHCVNVDEFSHVGTCDSAPPTPTTDTPEREASCDGYAAHAKACGLLASEAEAIRQVCGQADLPTKQAMIACNASESCQELLACSGLQCFTSSDCPSSAPHCVLRTEVVDPFTDIPYHCR